MMNGHTEKVRSHVEMLLRIVEDRLGQALDRQGSELKDFCDFPIIVFISFILSSDLLDRCFGIFVH